MPIASLGGLVCTAQLNRQDGPPYRVEIWIESQGNISRVARICEPYGIDVFSGSGSVPIGAIRKAAFRVIEAARDGQPTLLFVIGDFDQYGVKNIIQALCVDLRAFVEDYGGDVESLEVRQIALTEAQALALSEIKRTELPNPPKDWPQLFKAEVEALDPDVLDTMIEDVLAQVRDPAALERAMAKRGSQRSSARGID